MHWDHEPGRRNGARLCEPQHVPLQTKLLRVTDPRSETGFMESQSVPLRFGPGGRMPPSPAAKLAATTSKLTGRNPKVSPRLVSLEIV